MNEPINEIPPEDLEADQDRGPQSTLPPSDAPPELIHELGLDEPARVQENPFKPAYQQMLKDIRIWGWSASVLGVLHFVISGVLNPAWGISLFAVGGISFLIREASMYVIYAVIMAWVGLSNVMVGSFGGWTIFGVLQAYWSYQLYRKYQVYAIVEKKYLELEVEQEEPSNRAKDTFPGCGCAMGVIGLVGALGVFILTVAAVAAREPDAPVPENLQVIDFIMGGLMASGILGFALSVAALVSGHPRKWLAWIGALAGGLLMAFEIYLRFTTM